MNAAARQSDEPFVSFRGLDELWFQVAGTLCNLACSHCFISCSPHNHGFGMLTLETVERTLAEAVRLGVKEYYFTGGEPFLNRELVPMLERTLEVGPASVLTNATVLKQEWLERLRIAEDRSLYSLEFRVSIDGPTAELNDIIRGAGAFDRAMQGVELLLDSGFLPIITMTRVWDENDDQRMLDEFRSMLRSRGDHHPRLKILPSLKLGAEATRTCGYSPGDRITVEMMHDFDDSQLICSHSRVVTDRGVFVCPILLDAPEARMGQTLTETFRPFALTHGACLTCWQSGAICTNPSAKARPV